MKVNPWERQAGETAVAFEAFAAYRDMGVKRSQDAVAKSLSKSRALMARWGAQHSWVDRARAWDAEQDRVWREEQGELRREVAKKHARVFSAMMGKAVAALQSTDATKLSPADIEKWLRTAALGEQAAVGGLDDETENSVKAAAGVITELVRQVRGQP